MGTTKRNVIRGFMGRIVGWLGLSPEARAMPIPEQQRPPERKTKLVQYAPDWLGSYFNRDLYNTRWAATWFRETFGGGGRFVAVNRTDTKLHYIHRGHPHGAKRRNRVVPNPCGTHDNKMFGQERSRLQAMGATKIAGPFDEGIRGVA